MYRGSKKVKKIAKLKEVKSSLPLSLPVHKSRQKKEVCDPCPNLMPFGGKDLFCPFPQPKKAKGKSVFFFFYVCERPDFGVCEFWFSFKNKIGRHFSFSSSCDNWSSFLWLLSYNKTYYWFYCLICKTSWIESDLR